MCDVYCSVIYVCWVLMVGGQFGMFDDGELLGMVGCLMLEVLCYYELDGVLVMVVCYYGGVKFGVGGLVCVYIEVIVIVFKSIECIECVV